MITETSQKAFNDILPSIGNRQNAVLGALESLKEATNSEIARHLEWSINTVTPRTNELVKKGLVISVGKRPCKVTGRTAYVWTLNPKQLTLV